MVAALDGGRNHWTGDFPLWVNVLAFIIIFLGGSLEIVNLSSINSINLIQISRVRFLALLLARAGYANPSASKKLKPAQISAILW